jgi:hypothetical protein
LDLSNGRGHVDEVPLTCLGEEYQPFSPTHTSAAAQDVDDAFEVAVMVGTGLCVGLNRNRTGPDLLRTDPCEVDRRRTVHPRRLRSVRVEGAAGYYGDSVIAPVSGSQGSLLSTPAECYQAEAVTRLRQMPHLGEGTSAAESVVADQPVSGSDKAGHGAIGNAKLGIDVFDMVSGRLARNHQAVSYFGVFEPQGDQPQHFHLPRG